MLLIITGVSYFSLNSYANLTNSFASELSDGSKTGILAALATALVSCSFCELYSPGSSATIITSPPFTPIYDAVNSGSAATFRPTCFMEANALTPTIDAPIATSNATFSFGDHSEYISVYLTILSLISVLGVPGYAADTLQPASYAPRANASFPSISILPVTCVAPFI